MTTINERVKDGAEFLNFIYGDEWKQKINLETLDLQSGKSCILGQTDSNFLQHANHLKLDMEDTRQFGFLAESNSSIFNNGPEYSSLTKAWKQYLRQH